MGGANHNRFIRLVKRACDRKSADAAIRQILDLRIELGANRRAVVGIAQTKYDMRCALDHIKDDAIRRFECRLCTLACRDQTA